MTIIMTILPKYISLLVGILVSRLKLSGDSGFSSKIETIPPNSGRLLDTRQAFFLGGGCFPRRNLKSLNCWKCTEIVNLIITVLFLYHFKYFTIPSGAPFWFLGGGGCVHTPRTPPCLRACNYRFYISSLNRSFLMLIARNT